MTSGRGTWTPTASPWTSGRGQWNKYPNFISSCPQFPTRAIRWLTLTERYRKRKSFHDPFKSASRDIGQEENDLENDVEGQTDTPSQGYVKFYIILDICHVFMDIQFEVYNMKFYGHITEVFQPHTITLLYKWHALRKLRGMLGLGSYAYEIRISISMGNAIKILRSRN